MNKYTYSSSKGVLTIYKNGDYWGAIENTSMSYLIIGELIDLINELQQQAKEKPKYSLVRRHQTNPDLDQWQMTYMGYTFNDLRPAYMTKSDHELIVKVITQLRKDGGVKNDA